jgi:hypothetical protein
MPIGMGNMSSGISPAPEAFGQALSRARAERPGGVEELRAAIYTYAAQLRREGVPPERTLVAIKTLVYEGLSTLRPSEAEERRLSLAVRWCIAAYYEGAA